MVSRIFQPGQKLADTGNTTAPFGHVRKRLVLDNTIALFVRQILILAINLYMIRTLLQVLGVTDFAVYAVVYNIILMSSFLWGAIQTITQRFFAFAIGAGDLRKAKAYFSTSIALCTIVAVLTCVAFEVLGVWFVEERMAIAPESREVAVFTLRAFIVFAAVKVFSTFFAAIIMAHEDMRAYAGLAILEAVLRLGAALVLFLSPFEQLVTFAVLYSASACLVAVAFATYAIRKYPECTFSGWEFDLAAMREMCRFSGWTAFGQMTTVCRNQAVTVLINQAYDPATVAARALSMSIGAQVLALSNNFSAALNPPITKTWAAGHHNETHNLICFGSKLSFFLVWIATLPLLATMPGILTLWLGEYPEQTAIFARLALVENAIVALSFPLMAAVRAAGDMRAYELILGLMQVMVLIASMILVLRGYPATVVYIVAIIVNTAMFAARLWLTNQKTGLSILVYTREVIGRVATVVVLSSAATLGILHLAPTAPALNPSALPAIIALFVLPAAIAFWFGMRGSERRAVFQLLQRRAAP